MRQDDLITIFSIVTKTGSFNHAGRKNSKWLCKRGCGKKTGRVIMSLLCRKGELRREWQHLSSLQRWWNKPWLAMAEEIWGSSPADLIWSCALPLIWLEHRSLMSNVFMSYQHKAGAPLGWLEEVVVKWAGENHQRSPVRLGQRKEKQKCRKKPTQKTNPVTHKTGAALVQIHDSLWLLSP